MLIKFQSGNFLLALLILVGSFFGAPEALSTQVGMSIIALLASAGAIRQFLPSAKFDSIKARFADPNTWNYIAGLVATLGIPNLDQAVPALHDFVNAFSSGNWGLIVSRGVSLITILFYLFVKK